VGESTMRRDKAGYRCPAFIIFQTPNATASRTCKLDQSIATALPKFDSSGEYETSPSQIAILGLAAMP